MTLIEPFQQQEGYNVLGSISQPSNSANSPVYAELSRSGQQNGARRTPLLSWVPACHPLVDPVTLEVDAWFLDNWPFPSDKARQKFVAAGFSRVTCLYFPLAKDDRIAYACRLLAILFLIDDLLEYMSLEDSKAYNERLMPLARGDAQPDRTIPVEAIFYNLWASMREKDRYLADQVLEPTFIRAEITEIGQYLQYRERDVGKAWEKELKQLQVASEEGSILCSGVKVFANSTELSIDAAKTCFLEYKISRNELWSKIIS
ncbi:terpenoid synthase [Coniochaeta ligniaria NRRL 30616]|uniref:Terpenoid synthase n=1 Tax=Coniochaeta ligniaria NRRL 30616 TaxID=1408157 RepID=A0A1J7INF9_9PEZI|nr:terpenoid synthase [Coniochaeta ligniaria NRRL 30616]